jgi:aspartate/methionine/tyrosine aminotransferase
MRQEHGQADAVVTNHTWSDHMASADTLAAARTLMMRPPSERSAIAPFIVMDVMSEAAAVEASGTHVIHMEVGQPGTPAPRAAIDAVKRALDIDTLGYTLALGLPRLRERIAWHYRECYGVSIAPERVIVTTGSSAAFVLAFLALFDAGARVALPSPGYPCYRHILTALGQEPVILATGPETRWMPTAQQIAQASERQGIAGVLIASPANPTGTMLEPQRLAEIVEACRRRRLWFLSDEIYHGLTYGLPAAPARFSRPPTTC